MLIGLGAGLVSAVLLASTFTGSALAIALFYLTPLPGFLAGLGWGSMAAWTATLTGSAVLSIGLGPKFGFVYFLVLGLPAALLCYLALLSRPASQPNTASGPSGNDLEWYPVGRLIAWATLMVGCMSLLIIPFFGFDADAFRSAIQDQIQKLVGLLAANAPKELAKNDLAPMASLLAFVLPAGFTVSWLGILLFNFWAAGKIVAHSGKTQRPAGSQRNCCHPESP